MIIGETELTDSASRKLVVTQSDTITELHVKRKQSAIVVSAVKVFPNPISFRRAVGGVLKFSPLMPGFVLRVFDSAGRKIRELNSETRMGKSIYGTAEKTVYWDGTDEDLDAVGRGIYFWQCSLEDGSQQSGKILILE